MNPSRTTVAWFAALLIISPAARAQICPDFDLATRLNAGLNRGPQAVIVKDFNGDGHDDIAVSNALGLSSSVSIFLGDGHGGFTEAPGSPFPTGDHPCTMAAGDFNGDGKWDLATANCGSDNVTILLGNGDGTFTEAAGSPVSVGAAPNGIVAGDFNGDGKSDLAVVNQGDGTVSILLGNGDGTFAPASGSPIAVGNGPDAIVAGNFDAGPTLDLAVANSGDNSVSILLGNGNGTFTAAAPVPVGSYPNWIAAADFNGDGKADLAVTNEGDNSVSILEGHGNGTFTATAPILLERSPAFVLADDLSGDGRADLTVLFGDDFRAAILLGNGDGTFAAPAYYAADNGPSGAATGDFNSDGRKDLIITDWDVDALSLLYGNGDGTFIGARLFNAGGDSTVAGVATDLNGDGKPDLTIVNTDSNNISLFLGNGSGSLTPSATEATGSAPSAVVAADFNGDTKPDLAVANSGSNDVSIFLGNGDGTVGAPATVAAGTAPSAIAAADFNGDGKIDLAVANSGSNDVSILLGNGNGTFTAAGTIAAGSSPSAIVAGDFNGDGKIDLAVANSGSNDVSVLLGNGNGTFTAATPVAAGASPSSIAAADFNADGKLDLAVANEGDSTVSILLGNGNGTFTAAAPVSVDAAPRSVAVGDFDGNGVPDLITANLTNGTISALLGKGNGTFARSDFKVAPAINSLPSVRAVVPADFNGDGHTDVAVLQDQPASEVWILMSDCSLPATQFHVAAPPSAAPGSSFSFSLVALDQYGHAAPGYAGTVRFTSSDAAATLPANSTLTAGAGTFSATLRTAGAPTITATDTVISSITGTSNSIVVTAGAATHFAVSAPAAAIAGAPITVTVTALDAFNNTAASYAGSVHFTGSDATAILPANSMLSGGTGSFSVTLHVAGSQTVTATDAGSRSIAGVSNAIAVSAAGATHFTLTAPPGAVAGNAFAFSVTARDPFDNVATGYSGTVHFTSSDAGATLPANSTLAGGSGAFRARLATIGGQTITAADTVTSSIGGTSSAIDVSAGVATHFTVSAPASVIAGSAFSFTVTAFDAFGNTAASDSGIVHFSSSDPGAAIPANTALAGGSGTFVARLTTVGNQTITATDTVSTSITGTSSPIAVSAGAATHFGVSAPASVAPGTAFSFGVTALDSFDNTDTGYMGTVHFTSSDGAAVLPADSTLTAGRGTFAAKLFTAGAQTITAADSVSAAIYGTSGAIAVGVALPTITTLSITSGLTIGGQTVTISGTNLAGATAVTFGGTAGAIVSDTSTSLTVTTPPHLPGPVDVAVTTAGGTATATRAFTFVAPIPTLSWWMLLLLAAALGMAVIRDTFSQ